MNYGFVKDTEKDPRDYVYGSGQLTEEILCPSRDWSEYLPEYEPQFGHNWDPNNCTVHAILNALECLYKYRYGKAPNFSERYTTILAKVRPPGTTPKKAVETVRKYGVIGDSLLPMTDTYEEYLKPDPMNEMFISLGENFLYEHTFGYEFLWEDEPSIENAYAIIEKALAYSPVAISVTAWNLADDGAYKDLGQPNNHFCLCFAVINVAGIKRLKVFDTYDHSVKILTPDHHIEVAMRFHFDNIYWKTATKQDNWVVQLVKNLSSFIKDLIPKNV